MKLSEIKKEAEIKKLSEEEMKQTQGGLIWVVPVLLYAIVIIWALDDPK